MCQAHGCDQRAVGTSSTSSIDPVRSVTASSNGVPTTIPAAIVASHGALTTLLLRHERSIAGMPSHIRRSRAFRALRLHPPRHAAQQCAVHQWHDDVVETLRPAAGAPPLSCRHLRQWRLRDRPARGGSRSTCKRLRLDVQLVGVVASLAHRRAERLACDRPSSGWPSRRRRVIGQAPARRVRHALAEVARGGADQMR